MLRRALVSVSLIAATACGGIEPPSDPPAAAEGAITTFFAAISAEDAEALRASVTSDFEIVEDVAWTRYRNDAVLTQGGTSSQLVWMETAILRKVEGVWLVDRLHSMPFREPATDEGS